MKIHQMYILAKPDFNVNRVYTHDLSNSYYKGFGSCFGGLSKAVKNRDVDKQKLSENIRDCVKNCLVDINRDWVKFGEKDILIKNIEKLQAKFSRTSGHCERTLQEALDILNERLYPTHASPLTEGRKNNPESNPVTPPEKKKPASQTPTKTSPSDPVSRLRDVVHPTEIRVVPGRQTISYENKYHEPESHRIFFKRVVTRLHIYNQTSSYETTTSAPVPQISNKLYNGTAKKHGA